jgi:SAM-dependent methyltransferase
MRRFRGRRPAHVWLARSPDSWGSLQEEANSRVYASPRLVRAYVGLDLRPPETAFLRAYPGAVAGRSLDLGCGTGRLTAPLVRHGREVVGIDISPAMIEHCRQALPGVEFRLGDFRDLSAFEDASFDLVVAGFNLFDAVSHEDRIATLEAVRRILRPDGILFFSSHNRHCGTAVGEALSGPRLRASRHPARQARAAAAYLRARANRHRLGQFQTLDPDRAVLNDPAHGWGLLHYYIGRDAQRRQLADAGFELLEVIGMDGRTLPPGADDSGFSELHYVAAPRAGCHRRRRGDDQA